MALRLIEMVLPAKDAAEVRGLLKEHKVLGVPTDLGAGLALLGVSFFGGLGKYDVHGINIGSAATGAFTVPTR